MLIPILIVSSIASVADLFGWVLYAKREWTHKASYFIISFAAGALLGAAFLDIIPEALEEGATISWVLLGVLLFYIVEKFLILYHCHDGKCDVHPASYLMIIGDFLHDFIDGVAIAVAFLVDVRLGIVTAIAVALHEIPSGFGSFGVLIHSNATRRQIMSFVVLSSIAAPIGALLTYLASSSIEPFMGNLLALAAGGFIYIAAADLIPETHQEFHRRRALLQAALLFLGILAIYTAGVFIG